MSIFLMVLFDSFLMPKYVRMGTGRYMVNVIEKNISYGQKVLDSEGKKKHRKPKDTSHSQRNF